MGKRSFISVLTLVGFAVVLADCVDTGGPRPPLKQPTESPPLSTSPALRPAPSPADLPCVQTRHGCIALNPEVTVDTLAQTICVAGYTATIRPAVSYSNAVKAKLLRESGLEAALMSDYELDHLVPLGLGGHPRKLSNLALQPLSGSNSATKKDGFERQLQHMVCNGHIGLIEAQSCIAEDWQACAVAVSAGRFAPPR